MFASILKPYLSEDQLITLEGQARHVSSDPTLSTLARIFTAMPRHLEPAAREQLVSVTEPLNGRNGMPLIVNDWTVVRLARVWVLHTIPAQTSETYKQLIDQLFLYGDMDELVALYSALPIYHFPEMWRERCQEGIRSNIGPVRQAVMVDNHYPSRFLEEAAWNQLVLKAFFTEEPIGVIVGVDERNNKALADALVDYAYERYAAGRAIDPELWRLVAPFANERSASLQHTISEQIRK